MEIIFFDKSVNIILPFSSFLQKLLELQAAEYKQKNVFFLQAFLFYIEKSKSLQIRLARPRRYPTTIYYSGIRLRP